MTPSEHFQAGQLSEAIDAAVADVKKHPTDTSRRGLFCEMLCFTGEWERADKQLDTIGMQDPQAIVGLSMFRQLIRAEVARQQFYEEGRVPEFVGEPSTVLRLHLEASICLREGKTAEAAEALGKAEEQRAKVGGTCDGQSFDDFRDLDDLSAPILEVFTGTGKYFWIPVEQVEFLAFQAPERAHDLLWRRARIVVTDGPDGEVFLPSHYPGTFKSDDDRLRLGRGTEWSDQEAGPVRGCGQRMFLVGEEAKTIMEIGRVQFGVKQSAEEE